MPLDRRILSTLDTDTAPESVENGRARTMLNVQPERGYLTTLRGLVALPEVALPAGLNGTLDTVDLPGTQGGLAWLVWNSEDQHSVLRHLPPAAPELLLTWSGLNLPRPTPDAYVAAGVVDNLLVYLDADGEARSLPLDRLASGEYSAARLAAEPYGLHVVKLPPTQPLPVTRTQLPVGEPLSTLQLCAPKAWQFTYRWQYAGGETTVLAPFSTWLDVLENPANAQNHAISMRLPNPPAGVREVNILVRNPGDVGWRVAQTLRRDKVGAFPSTFVFVGITQGEAVQGDDATRPFEFLWPCRALTVAHNRLWYGYPRVGYPTPEPAFTLQVAPQAAGFTTLAGDVYAFKYAITYGSGYDTRLYVLSAGVYGEAGSLYLPVAQQADGSYLVLDADFPTTYQFGFVDPQPNETDPPERSVTVLENQLVSYPTAATPRTLPSRGVYRAVIQFYDALGRAGGCSQARTVQVPDRDFKQSGQLYALQVNLTTRGAAALNAEIPAWATSYQVLVSSNDRTKKFLQGVAADVLGYLGKKRIEKEDGTIYEYEQVVDVIHVPHEKVWVDIGNLPPVGQGYVWQAGSGDVLRFLNEGKEFVITGQYGDYLEVIWSGYPDKSTDATGQTVARIEIYSPSTTQANTYYERGPRLGIARTGSGDSEQRRYSQTQIAIEGDAFLISLRFPQLVKGAGVDNFDVYKPPGLKSWKAGEALTTIESMVPLYRLAPVTSTVATIVEAGVNGSSEAQTSTTTAASGNRPADSLLWLDMSYGGRPGTQIPLALQQVSLSDTFGFSGQRLAGSLLNGLSLWQAADQRTLAREQGPIRVLASADDVQSEDQSLLAICEQGVVSIGINVARVRQAGGGSLTADTSQVVGYINSLGGRYGTRHPRSVQAAGGRLFWWCADQAEVCRYAKDGVNPLNTQRQCRALGAELVRSYPTATVTAGYDSASQEYLLCLAGDSLTGTVARTVRYSDRAGGFVGDAGIFAEAVQGTANRRTVFFQGGQAWEYSDAAPRLNFFGYAAAAEVSTWANAVSSVSKTYLALEIESGPEMWTLTRAETPSGQYTWLPPSRMERLEDRWHGALLLDATSPGFTGTDGPRRALYEGVPMQGLALCLTLRCVSPLPTARLLAVGVEYFINGGQAPPQ